MPPAVKTALIHWRKRERLDRAAAAEFLSKAVGNVSIRTLEKWERGERVPGEITANAIRKAIQ